MLSELVISKITLDLSLIGVRLFLLEYVWSRLSFLSCCSLFWDVMELYLIVSRNIGLQGRASEIRELYKKAHHQNVAYLYLSFAQRCR